MLHNIKKFANAVSSKVSPKQPSGSITPPATASDEVKETPPPSTVTPPRRDSSSSSTSTTETPATPTPITEEPKEIEEAAISISAWLLAGTEQPDLNDLKAEAKEAGIPEPVNKPLEMLTAFRNDARFSDPAFEEYKNQLDGIYHSFMSLKKCMNIPSKKDGTRKRLANQTTPLSPTEALTVWSIVADKVVLNHAKFVDDFAKLIKMFENRTTMQIEKFNENFDNQIKYLLNDFHPKEEYLKEKMRFLSQTKDEDFNVVVDAFQEFTRNCSYYLGSEIPTKYKNDNVLQELKTEEDGLSKKLHQDFQFYFNRQLTTTEKFPPREFIQYKTNEQSVGEKAENLLTGLVTDVKKRAKDLEKNFQELRTNKKQYRKNITWDKTLTKTGQSLLKEDSAKKNKSKEIAARIEVLEKAEKKCLAQKAKLEKLINDANRLGAAHEIDVSAQAQSVTNLINTFNNQQFQGEKDFEVFFNSQTRDFTSEIIRLNGYDLALMPTPAAAPMPALGAAQPAPASALPDPVPGTIELKMAEQKENFEGGYAYRVIGVDNEVKEGVISWTALALPEGTPRELAQDNITNNKDILLHAILEVTSKKGQTYSSETPLVKKLKQIETNNVAIDREEKNHARLETDIKRIKREAELASGSSVSLDELVKNMTSIFDAITHLPKVIFSQNQNIKTALAEQKTVLEQHKQKSVELEALKKRLEGYQNSVAALGRKKLSAAQIKNRYEFIESEAKDYWVREMKVQFTSEVEANIDILDHLEHDHDDMMAALEELEPKGFLSKLMRDTGDLIKNTVDDVLYKTFCRKNGLKPTEERSRREFDRELEKIGFNDDEYQKLINDARRLLAKRDRLLLNEKLNNDADIAARDAFIARHNLQGRSKKAIDLTINIDYMKQLKKLIDGSFLRIYDAHQRGMDQEVNNPNSLRNILIRLTTGAEKYSEQRQICSGQMLVGYLESMANYLDKMKDLRSVKARRYVRMTQITFIAGAIGCGVWLGLTIASGGTVLFPAIAVGCCLAGVAGAQLALKFLDRFKYKRSATDRKELASTAKQLRSEADRLRDILNKTVATDKRHQDALKQLDAINQLNAKVLFEKIAGFLKTGEIPNKRFFIGAFSALLDEYYNRYKHSPFMQINFKNTLNPLLTRSAKQTQDVQQTILANLADNSYSLKLLDEYLAGTGEFLEAAPDTELGQFKKTMKNLFKIKQKIREQFLEIVSVIGLEHELPPQLVTFYTKNLKGSVEDLNRVRRLNSLTAVQDAAQAQEGNRYPEEQNDLRSKMNSQRKPVFAGTDSDRAQIGRNAQQLAGWSEAPNGLAHAENVMAPPITPATIKDYLNNSLAFLISLNARHAGLLPPAGLDLEIKPTEHYITYFGMFAKQMAACVDHTSLSYQPLCEKPILEFAKEKLLIDDPKKFFSDIQHRHNLLNADQRLAEDAADEQAVVENEAQAAAAVPEDKTDSSIPGTILLITACHSKKTSPRDLIKEYVVAGFIEDEKNEEKARLFGWRKKDKDILKRIGTPITPTEVKTLETIISHTEKLFREILTKNVLTDYQVDTVYLRAAVNQSTKAKTAIEAEILRRAGQDVNSQPMKSLNAAKDAIERHHNKLKLMQQLQRGVFPENAAADVNVKLQLHFTDHGSTGQSFFSSGKVVFGPPENADQKRVLSDLLIALCVLDGKDTNRIQFNLACLRGDDDWKVGYRKLLSPYLSPADKALMQPPGAALQPRAGA